jgi:hypothetical protein
VGRKRWAKPSERFSLPVASQATNERAFSSIPETNRRVGYANLTLISRCSNRRQASPHHLHDALVDFLNRTIAVNGDYTQRVAGSNLLVFIEDPTVERGTLCLKPVLIAPRGRNSALVAAACAG